MKEIWKDVIGYEGIYMVSNLGRVKSINYNKTGKEKILSTHVTRFGYVSVTLYNKKEKKTSPQFVHRLVALSFIENDDPISKTQINHKDECKTNNNSNNLEWCTPAYNMAYGTRKERATRKNRDEGYAKMAEYHKIKVICVNTGEIFNSVKDAAEKYKIHPSCISRCCKGKTKTSGVDEKGNKLKWKYLENSEVTE